MTELLQHCVPGPAPAAAQPEGWVLADDTAFDPAVHLQLEVPATVKDLEFNTLPFPYSAEEAAKKRGFAYSAPFRVLSEAGVAAARRAIDEGVAKYDDVGKGNDRAAFFVRGTGYTSAFMRALTYAPEVAALCGSMARDPLAVHTMTLNAGHTNVGKPDPTGRPVDKWHTDSVDYVLVVVLSDFEGMEGGRLKVLQEPDASGSRFAELLTAGVPDCKVERHRYPGAGYGIFMQGSKILHAVEGVTQAKEPRYSVVTSFMSRDVFAKDLTRYHTFTQHGFGDRMDVVPVEYARHKAWRIQGQMDYILNKVPFGRGPASSGPGLAALLRAAAAELEGAAALLNGEANDNAAWVDEDEGNDKGGGEDEEEAKAQGGGDAAEKKRKLK